MGAHWLINYTRRMEAMEQAVGWLKESTYTTAFTGAGISVESGIPPFRGPNGLWSKYDPSVLDLQQFYQHPKESWLVIKELFYDFFGSAQPNAAHIALARMEQAGMLESVITQNIDNLHQDAGSQRVWEFHGNSRHLVCTQCDKRYPAHEELLHQLPPRCSCKGLLKPDFIFFGEGIPPVAYEQSFEEARKAQVFLVIGTTGEIVPASYVVHDAKAQGTKIIEVNTEPTQFTYAVTDVFLKGKATQVMKQLEEMLLT